MLILAAYFRIIVIDIFQNVTQTDALRVSHNTYLVHRRQLVFQLAFDEKE